MKKIYIYVATLYVAMCVIFSGCSEKDVTGSEVTNENVISLTGNVIDHNGKGVPGVVARLATYGFVDTTNITGEYTINISKDSLDQLGIDLTGAEDTLYVSQQDNLLNSFSVTDFVDTLPDTYLIQRNIWGALATDDKGFSRVAAFVKEKSSDSSQTKSIELWLNSSFNTYSGFIYMLQPLVPTLYEIYVQVYDGEGRPTGRSETVEFPQNAGDIQMPDIDVTNLIPVATSSTTTPVVSINDTIILHASATDLHGRIEEWAWDIGNTGSYIILKSGGEFRTIGPTKASSSYLCFLRVTDDDGNRAYSRTTINVLNDSPAATATTTTPTVSVNDTIHLQGTAFDGFGDIVTWEWDIGNTGTFIDANNDSGHVGFAPTVANSAYPCVLRVTDDDGNIATSTVNINVLQDAPIAEAGRHSVCSMGDVITLRGTGKDSFGTIQSYEWKFHNGPWIQTSSGDTAVVVHNVNEPFICSLRVTDDDGECGYDDIIFYPDMNVMVDVDNNVYKTVKIGNQIWMAENLRVKHHDDGTPIPQNVGQNDKEIRRYSWCYYNYDSTSVEASYGLLYTGYVANDLIPPEGGWHVPTWDEWYTLFFYLKNNGLNSGKGLASNTGWKVSNSIGVVGNNPLLNNSVGFEAYPSGQYTFFRESFQFGGETFRCYAKTEPTVSDCYFISLDYKDSSFTFSNNFWAEPRYNAMAIRLVKNAE